MHPLPYQVSGCLGGALLKTRFQSGSALPKPIPNLTKNSNLINKILSTRTKNEGETRNLRQKLRYPTNLNPHDEKTSMRTNFLFFCDESSTLSNEYVPEN